jgi:hypothetical protein
MRTVCIHAVAIGVPIFHPTEENYCGVIHYTEDESEYYSLYRLMNQIRMYEPLVCLCCIAPIPSCDGVQMTVPRALPDHWTKVQIGSFFFFLLFDKQGSDVGDAGRR